ncbi:iron uptake protein [Pseudoxanthomonas sp. CF385]|uniref:iron uptake protein n=1 Tax=Pseudoxanthomonas sp. CF385 TaxID=1881042 RepID=UPI000B808E01|nr:iron uptake protein [Pseudoxanthomonas sp. CF385]
MSTTTMPSRSQRPQVVARVAAAMLGGYAFAWGIVATGASLMVAAGMDFHDAEFLGSMIGVLAFLGVFLWAIAARRLRWVWLVTVVGGGALAATGSFVQSLLV